MNRIWSKYININKRLINHSTYHRDIRIYGIYKDNQLVLYKLGIGCYLE